MLTSLWQRGPLKVHYSVEADSRYEFSPTGTSGSLSSRLANSVVDDSSFIDKAMSDDPSASGESEDKHEIEPEFLYGKPEEFVSRDEGDRRQFVVTSSGDVVLNRPLDRELHRTHYLTIVNETLESPPTLDYMTIVVVVMDINDNPPRFLSETYRVTISEDSPIGSTVIMLSATDEDKGNNRQVSYLLDNGYQENLPFRCH